MIALCLLTCDRLAYTEQTLATFAATNDPSRFLLLHADDASTDPAVPAAARQAGFETVVANRVRQGAHRIHRAAVTAAHQRGADWILLLENDWAWLRGFPWAVFEYVLARPAIYCVRLYGEFKTPGGRRAGTVHGGKTGRPVVTWAPVPDAPEPLEIGSIHYGWPPAVTRTAEAIWLHAGIRSVGEMIAKSGGLEALTARVVENVVTHIGTARTPGFRP